MLFMFNSVIKILIASLKLFIIFEMKFFKKLGTDCDFFPYSSSMKTMIKSDIILFYFIGSNRLIKGFGLKKNIYFMI